MDLEEQDRSGFGYAYSVYQAEYSRNLLFRVGAQMEQVFDRIVDRTRSRLDVPLLRRLFGAKQRPSRTGTPDLSLRLAAVIETPRYDLTLFKVHFGNLTLKAYTKGEHVLRFEAITHNTKQLRCGRVLEKFPDIISRLASMTDRFATTLDCVDTSFIPEGTLDDLPRPTQLGRTRLGGIDLNKPRIRTALTAVLTLSAAPRGFTTADLTAKVHAITGHTDYTTRQAAYDLRKFRGKDLIIKPSRSHHYHVPPHAARTITALITLREHIIAPILAGIRSPQMGRKPTTWTRIDRDYETLRINMHTLFHDLGITTDTAAA